MIELESKLIFFFEPYEFHILDLTITKCQTIFDALHIYWVHNVKMSKFCFKLKILNFPKKVKLYYLSGTQ